MNQSENSQFLGIEKIGKLMLKFSVPCMLSLLVSALYNIVDQIFSVKDTTSDAFRSIGKQYRYGS